ncbi:hypothetical protein BKA65DRAFT_478380 [Rhexocercosporidium sp. MPI-PUGE-AT-0058]|nr:hypothetical protein BKA65DRAFT_478380 [Rhexocercosporidium sp. MPI-PUGE-AT-0058]
MDPSSNLASSDNNNTLFVQSAGTPTSALTSSTSPSTSAASAPTTVLVSQDSNGQLTIHAGAQIFTCFGRMPNELKAMVWKRTFSDRETIALGHVVYKSEACGDAERAWKRENTIPLPVALCVNQQSRTEALKHFTIIDRSQIAAPVKFGGLRPICAKSTDLFWLEFVTLVHSPDELHDWLSAVKTEHTEFFKSITKLEVRGTFTERFFVMIFNDNRTKNMASQDFRKMYCGSFLLFPALKEITFTGKKGDRDWENAMGRMVLKGLENWIVGFLKNARSAFNDHVAPTVTFRPFMTFENSLYP